MVQFRERGAADMGPYLLSIIDVVIKSGVLALRANFNLKNGFKK